MHPMIKCRVRDRDGARRQPHHVQTARARLERRRRRPLHVQAAERARADDERQAARYGNHQLPNESHFTLLFYPNVSYC